MEGAQGSRRPLVRGGSGLMKRGTLPALQIICSVKSQLRTEAKVVQSLFHLSSPRSSSRARGSGGSENPVSEETVRQDSQHKDTTFSHKHSRAALEGLPVVKLVQAHLFQVCFITLVVAVTLLCKIPIIVNLHNHCHAHWAMFCVRLPLLVVAVDVELECSHGSWCNFHTNITNV